MSSAERERSGDSSSIMQIGDDDDKQVAQDLNDGSVNKHNDYGSGNLMGGLKM